MLLLLIGCYWMLREVTPYVSEARELSTFRADPAGGLAFYRVLQELGLEPRRLGRALRLEPERGVLFIANPPDDAEVPDAYSDEELDALDHWTDAGNTVVIVCRGPNAFTTELGLGWKPIAPTGGDSAREPPRVTQDEASRRGADRQVRPMLPTRVASLSGSLLFMANTAPAAALDLPACVDFADSDGRAAVLTYPAGEGRYVVVCDTFPMSNSGLGEAENLRFLVGLAMLYRRDGGVYFDEYHHGFETELGVMAYLRQRNAHFVVIQLGLVALGAAWLAGRRFGPIIPLVADPRRDAAEYAVALANVYGKAKMAPHVADVLARGFRHSVAGWLHLQARWSDERALAIAARRAPAAREELARALDRIRQPSGRPHGADLSELAQTLAAFERRFIHGEPVTRRGSREV